MQTELPVVVPSNKVGMIIVDSIAATFRSEFDNEIASRTRILRLIVRSLHDLAFNNKLVLVCLNQVNARFGMASGFNNLICYHCCFVQVGASMSTNILEYKDFAPSLGLAWRNLVNNRIVVSKKKDGKRWLEVPFSCYIPVRSTSFELDAEGVSAPPNTGVKYE